jgi:hypothetical protein
VSEAPPDTAVFLGNDQETVLGTHAWVRPEDGFGHAPVSAAEALYFRPVAEAALELLLVCREADFRTGDTLVGVDSGAARAQQRMLSLARALRAAGVEVPE